MRRFSPTLLFFVSVAAVSAVAWSQTTDTGRSANPTSGLGTSNPLSGGTAVNPTLDADPALRAAQQGTVGEGGVVDTDPTLNHAGNSTGVAQHDWRMVQHNGRWWYWTPNNSWLYRRGDQWMAYVPHGDMRSSGPHYSGSSAVDESRRFQAGYRGTTRLQGDTAVRSGVGQSQLQMQVDPRTGLSTNANTPGFEPMRPLSPTADEMQGFYRQQGIQAAPYGGTTGGTQNATPLGGGTYRSGTGETGPATFGTPQTNVPGASPITSSPGNPGAVGSPGNPSSAGAAGTPGAAGPATGAGSSLPAGGTSGAAGASGAGGTGS